MGSLQVVSTQPFAGKTTVVIAIAQGLAQAGGRISLIRAGSGPAAAADAATFADVLFAGTPGQAVDFAQVPTPAAGETVIVELDAGAPLLAMSAIIAVRGTPGEADGALAEELGERLIGTVAIAVAPNAIEAVARELTNRGLRPLALIPEDRLLAAPSVGELRDALGARVLFAGENENETVEDILIGPVYADPARPHFRRFASKAILAPFNKTDLHIAAIETEAACLVITGGRDPSPYVVDRAQHGNTTVLLAPQETPQTVTSLSEVWFNSRFRGERKAAIAVGHLEGRVDFAALARKIGQ
jgi:BioD-like phosphotransacetylase family protein